MGQTITGLLGPGGSFVNGVITFDAKNAAYNGYGINTPANMTPAQAVGIMLKQLSTLTAANDDPTAAIAAGTFASTPQYIASRGTTATSQMRESIELYTFYESVDPTGDLDNFVN